MCHYPNFFCFFTLFWWNFVRWRIKHIFWVRKSLIFAFTTLRWSGPKSWAMVQWSYYVAFATVGFVYVQWFFAWLGLFTIWVNSSWRNRVQATRKYKIYKSNFYLTWIPDKNRKKPTHAKIHQVLLLDFGTMVSIYLKWTSAKNITKQR